MNSTTLLAASFWLTSLQGFTGTIKAQSLRYSISMPYVSLGAYSTKQQDPFAFTNNQAALAKTANAGMGVYGERRYLLAENAVYGFAAVFPSRLGNFGIQANYSGFRDFNENKIGLAYARSLGTTLDLGVQFNYYGNRIPAYGAASSICFEAGAILHCTDKLNAGIHAYNPVGGKLGKLSEERLASAFKFGVGYDASDAFFVSAEILKEEDKPVNIISGVQYQFRKQFFIRAGIMSDTGSGFGGGGVGWKNFRLDISASYHPHLGISPGMMLILNFKESTR